jgi:predicted SAM-dependent methyltransferase
MRTLINRALGAFGVRLVRAQTFERLTRLESVPKAEGADVTDGYPELAAKHAKLAAQVDWLKTALPHKALDPDYPGADQLPLYLKLYGAVPVLEKRFYNVGSAWNKHALWTNVDYPSDWYAGDQKDNLDLSWDISSGNPIDVESGKAKIVYTSHTIEHLQDHHIQHFFNEAHRILEKGGFFRITCPDIILYYEGYKRRDPHLLLYTDAYPRFSIQDLFLNEFASQNTNIMRAGNPQGASSIVIPDEEVDRVFAGMPLDDALDHFTAMCDYELHKKAMGAHINWWHYEKIAKFLKQAGFNNVRRSGHGQSFCPAIRDTRYFDSTSPRFSIYVEAEKD